MVKVSVGVAGGSVVGTQLFLVGILVGTLVGLPVLTGILPIGARVGVMV